MPSGLSCLSLKANASSPIPLVNLFGEIIGINVAIYSPDTQSRGFLGVGFSLPSNDVEESFLQILERGRPVRSTCGGTLILM